VIELHCVGFLFYMNCKEAKQKRPALNDFCVVSELIRPSRKDTPDTLRQIIRHNKKYRALKCERKEGPKNEAVSRQHVQPQSGN
jgi:hypothetical protein